MGMGFALTWLRQVSPLLHMTTLTTGMTYKNSKKKHEFMCITEIL